VGSGAKSQPTNDLLHIVVKKSNSDGSKTRVWGRKSQWGPGWRYGGQSPQKLGTNMDVDYTEAQ